MWTEFNQSDGSCACGNELSEDFVQCSGSFKVILLCNLRANISVHMHLTSLRLLTVVKSKLYELE
jgi:hypothetical protein